MKVIRRLTRRGNSFHVSIPPQIVDHLRWKITDGIVVEVTADDNLLMRRVTPADLGAASIQPMNLSLPPLVSK
jgi:antitoxin component of MazEF toxin-antitoxin module